EDPDSALPIRYSVRGRDGDDDESSHDDLLSGISMTAGCGRPLKDGSRLWKSAASREKVRAQTGGRDTQMDGASGAGTTEPEVRPRGPMQPTRGRERVALGGPKPRALLAVLALEPGRVVSVDRLVEALWPGDSPETAAHAVQVYVSQLRKALGPVLATRAPGYQLELDPERIDVHRFARLTQEGHAALEGGAAASAEAALREALALWRGPALADFLYEPFAQTEIARLEELRTVTLEERIEADLALGRHVELVSELEALVAAQPLRERPRGQLM